MKLKREPIEIKDPEMGAKSDLQNEDDSLENTSAVSPNQSTTDGSQLKMSAEQIAANSEEKKTVKEEIFELLLVHKPVPQNAYSKFKDCIIASTSKSNSSESQEYKLATEENNHSFKDKVTVKEKGFEVFLVDKSAPQNTNSKSEDYMITSTTESQEYKIPSKENVPASKEVEIIKLEETDMCMVDVNTGCPPDSVEGLLTKELNSNESHQHEVPSKENLSAAEVPNGILNIEDGKSHRENVHYLSESSDNETDDSSSLDGFFDKLHEKDVPSQLPALKTKGELFIEDLPLVEDLDLNVNATELEKIGNVLHTVISKELNEYLVVVASDGNSNPIDEESVLFLSSDNPLGKIHEVFGNVNKANYTVRFNKAADIYDKGVVAGQDVYYLPTNDELTHYVLVDALKQQKGSDASWKDNNEPPDDQIDYSDDEQEKLAKQKRRAKNRRSDREGDDAAPNKLERRHDANNQERAFLARPSRNKFRSPTPSASRSSPHPRSASQSFGPRPPPSNIFHLQRNCISPEPFGFNSSNNMLAIPARPFLESIMSAPQPFGSSPHSNGPSPQPFGSSPYSSGPSPQLFGSSPYSNGPSPQPFGTFLQSSVPSYQPFPVPPTSNVLAPPNFASSHSTSVQQNPSFLMAAPQNNVPLQQQILLQSQQPIASFLSHPPPNYNSNQNSRTFLHQFQSFAHPMFGAPPAVRPTMQNIPNQSSANQIIFSVGTNYPPTSLSSNLNISQPTNSNGLQNQSYSMVQSNSTNSFIFPQFSSTNTQHNNAYPQITQPVFVHNQSPFVPCPTPPFIPCQTPPPSIINQQGLSVLSSSHPPVLPSQTPPPTIQPFVFALPAAVNPMPPQNYPYC